MVCLLFSYQESAIPTDSFFSRYKPLFVLQCQTGKVKLLDCRVVSVSHYNLKLLCVFVGDLENAIHIRVSKQLHQSAALRWFKSDFYRGGSFINTAKFKCQEVSRSPVCGQCSCIDVFQSAGYGTVSNLDIRLKVTYICAEYTGLTTFGLYGETA